MLKVSKILSEKKISNIIHVKPETTVIEALEIMAAHNIGTVVVLDDSENLVGIFSERDYARKGILQGRKAKSTPISEVMTPKVFTVEPEMTIQDCMEIMSERKFRHLPVKTKEGKLVGLLSVGDIVTALIKEQHNRINFLESYITGR